MDVETAEHYGNQMYWCWEQRKLQVSMDMDTCIVKPKLGACVSGASG